MSKRTVNDPSLHGWIDDNGKWVWEGGKDTGHILDGDTDGQVTTWSDSAQEWTPSTTVKVSGGRSTFTANSEPYAVEVRYNDSTTGMFLGSPALNEFALSYPSGVSAFEVGASGMSISVGNTGAKSLTIDATGNATFSGEVFSPNINGANYLSTSATALGMGVSGKSRLEFYANGAPDSAVFYNESGVRNFYIAQSGDATFSGTVDAAGFTVNGSPIGGGGGDTGSFTFTNSGAMYATSGLQFYTAQILPIDSSGALVSTGQDLGSTGRKFNNAYFAGTVNALDHVATSDERLKDNITTAPVGLIDSLQGREWDWKESGEKASGVVAQELEQVLPHLVHDGHDGMKSVSYAGLVAYLIEEVKALKAEVEALKNG